jgi:hypothetical protein
MLPFLHIRSVGILVPNYLDQLVSIGTRSIFHKSKTLKLCGHRTVVTLCMIMWKNKNVQVKILNLTGGKVAHYPVCM